MSRKRVAWQSLIVAFVLVAGCFYATNAVAQIGNGACVVSTTTINIPCQGGCSSSGCTCRGQITLTEPNGGYGGGILYSTIDASCCSTKFSVLGSGDGQCSVHTPVRAQLAEPAENNLVFVRGCDGRFKLYSVGGHKSQSGRES
jgi:hypothetical protein